MRWSPNRSSRRFPTKQWGRAHLILRELQAAHAAQSGEPAPEGRSAGSTTGADGEALAPLCLLLGGLPSCRISRPRCGWPASIAAPAEKRCDFVTAGRRDRHPPGCPDRRQTKGETRAARCSTARTRSRARAEAGQIRAQVAEMRPQREAAAGRLEPQRPAGRGTRGSPEAHSCGLRMPRRIAAARARGARESRKKPESLPGSGRMSEPATMRPSRKSARSETEAAGLGAQSG